VERPELLSALVLLCPGIPGHPWAEEAEGEDADLEARWNQAIKDGDADALAVIFAGIWAAGDGGLTDAVMEQLRSAARADIAIAGRQQDDPPAWDRLGEITAPVALMAGDADFAPLLESNKQAAERIPGCDYTLVPGMDHLPALRQPALVLDIIKRTLARAV
jgi:3-oxoadipate enol-lactonase